MEKHMPIKTSREPQQGRSRASYKRMIVAAEKLMVKKGNDDFTLTDVAKLGKVSIGSIYLRFSGKDELIRMVHSQVLARIHDEQDIWLTDILAGSPGLGAFMKQFVDRFAESMSKNSLVLRPFMLRATYDHLTSEMGKNSHDGFANRVRQHILSYSPVFQRSDHERVVNAAYRVVYSTIARYLGLGSSPESTHEGNWEEMKEDLATMCTAFLRAPAWSDDGIAHTTV